MPLFYQKHSETSKEAAQRNTTAANLSKKIYAYIAQERQGGATGGEIAEKFDIQTGTASARLRDLELSGQIVKTAQNKK